MREPVQLCFGRLAWSCTCAEIRQGPGKRGDYRRKMSNCLLTYIIIHRWCMDPLKCDYHQNSHCGIMENAGAVQLCLGRLGVGDVCKNTVKQGPGKHGDCGER